MLKPPPATDPSRERSALTLHRNILFFAIILSAVLPVVPTPIEQDWPLGFHRSWMLFLHSCSHFLAKCNKHNKDTPCTAVHCRALPASDKSVHFEVPFGGLDSDFPRLPRLGNTSSQPLLGHLPLRFLKPMMYGLLSLDCLFFLEAIRMARG